MTPSFSVVMPAFNAARTIGASARSVLAQTHRDLELIIVDDGSTDETAKLAADIAAEDGRVRVLTQANAGPSAARNAGIEAARGDHIGFLDSDDLLMPRYAELMSAALEDEPEAGFAFTDVWRFDEVNGRIRKQTSQEYYRRPPAGASADEVLIALLEENFVPSTTTCRARVLASVGGYDTGLRGAEDWDLWIRIVSRGWRPVFAPGCLCVGRNRPHSLSKDEAMMWSQMREVVGRVAANEALSEQVRAVARRKAAEFERARARVETGGLLRVLRRAAAAGRRARSRYLHRSTWLASPPEEVAAAFPALARDYGKAWRE